MTSRFNFRVWDKENKKMVYPNGNGYFNLKNDTVIDGNGELFDLVCQETVDNCILMQSIGYTDGFNEELFEGDIVAYRIRNTDIEHYIVEYYNGSLVFKRKNKIDYFDIHYFVNNDLLNKLCVIGNIYENEELLNNKK